MKSLHASIQRRIEENKEEYTTKKNKKISQNYPLYKIGDPILIENTQKDS